MVKKISATEAKNNFGLLVEEVNAKGNKVVIEKNSIPIMIVSPIKKKIKPRKLTDKEFNDIRKGMKEFRENYKYSF